MYTVQYLATPCLRDCGLLSFFFFREQGQSSIQVWNADGQLAIQIRMFKNKTKITLAQSDIRPN